MNHYRTKPFGLLLPFFLLCACCLSVASAKDYKLYYLGGQSNMDGYGRVKELPAEFRAPQTDVPIFHGNTSPDGAAVDGRGVWAALRPGHGVGFKSDGKTASYSQRFGVELSFARRMRKLQPSAAIALIKYSRGGTSIDQHAAGPFGSWDPDFRGGSGPGQGVNQYDHFLAAIRRAMVPRDIDHDGEPDRLIPAGIVWMQGESDAGYSVEIARRYEANLKRLMDLIRAALREDDLPVVVGRISDSKKNEKKKTWRHGEIVRAAQMAFAKNDAAAAVVTTTDKYGYSDPWHYDSAGYLDLGVQFAEALYKLEKARTARRAAKD